MSIPRVSYSVTQGLPGGYRIQIVRRVADTPPEIKGEWAVHCTLCKRVDWVATYEQAVEVAHVDHPLTDRHQKWIGRVLVGRQPSELRGYHRRDDGMGICGECILPSPSVGYGSRHDVSGHPWTPAAVPGWVLYIRRERERDEMSERREERDRRQAHQVARRIEPEFVDVGGGWVEFSRPGRLDHREPSAIVEVRVAGHRVARVHVLADGRCFQNGRFIGTTSETERHFTRVAELRSGT